MWNALIRRECHCEAQAQMFMGMFECFSNQMPLILSFSLLAKPRAKPNKTRNQQTMSRAKARLNASSSKIRSRSTKITDAPNLLYDNRYLFYDYYYYFVILEFDPCLNWGAMGKREATTLWWEPIGNFFQSGICNKILLSIKEKMKRPLI